MKANKKMKVITLLLSIMMIAAMFSSAVLAAPIWDTTPGKTGTLTIHKMDTAGNDLAGAGYTLYKVADIDQEEDPSGVFTLVYDSLVASVTVDSATTAADFTKDANGKYAAAVLANITSHGQVKTGANGLAVFANLEPGIYLVAETERPEGVNFSNDFVVSIPACFDGKNWEYEYTAEPKNALMDASIEKTMTGADNDNTLSADKGDAIEYIITATLPSTFEETAFTKFDIKDTPDNDNVVVIDKSSIVVKVGNITLEEGTNKDYTIKANPGSPNGFIISFNIESHIEDEGTANAEAVYDKIPAGFANSAEITVKYTAILTDKAVPGQSYSNAVEIDYAYITPDGDEIDDPPPVIPEDPDPEVYTYSFLFKKVDASNDALNGAEFVLMRGDKYLKWVDFPANYDIETDSGVYGWTEVAAAADATVFSSGAGLEDGYVYFDGLAAGTYKIVETKAPDTYSLLKDPVTITVGESTTTDPEAATPVVSISVVNVKKGFDLPATGGMGIYLFTIGGVLIMAVAIILFARNRKKNAFEA